MDDLPSSAAAQQTGVASVQVLPGVRDTRSKNHPFGAKEPVEAEDLPVVTWANCNWSVQDMPPRFWSNGKHLLCQARLGGYVELEVDIRRTGRYGLDVYYTADHNFGHVAVSVDGKPAVLTRTARRSPCRPQQARRAARHSVRRCRG
jgi:hypothetical protein